MNSDMKQYLMPITLASVIMIAGIFAFSPVDQATTVHTDLIDDLDATGQLFCDVLYGTGDTDYDPTDVAECTGP